MLDKNPQGAYGRILTVDHEFLFRKEVVDYLEDNGFITYEASNGTEALALFREKTPDLVLSSWLMPLEDGGELLDIIKNESPETPIIIISESTLITEVIEALRLGAWDYITKPIQNMAVLEHAICKALESGRLVTENRKYRIELEAKNMQLNHSLAQLEEDQKAGKSVQQQLLPQAHHQYGDYTFSHKVIPSLFLSGDFVDHFQINEEKVGFYIVDVSGHGASSAFVTILLKSLVEQIAANYHAGHHDMILHPEQVLKCISDEIVNTNVGKYLTMVYCILDLKLHTLLYSVGGHYPSPLLYNGIDTSFLGGEGFAVGICKNAHFTSQMITLPPICAMGLFSDGIFEVIKGINLQEKESVLINFFQRFHQKSENTLQALGIENESQFPDDITLLLINRT